MAKTKKRTKRSVPIDRPLAKELALSAANDGTLYRQQISSCITNLAKKKAKGIYKREGAIRLMVYPIQSELAKYRKEYHFTQNVGAGTKLLAGKYLLDEYMDEINEAAGELKAKAAKKKTTKRKR
jgi:hypothetical protein